MSNSKKTAIVTGCSSGIGLATSQLFLSKQFNVFGIDIADFKSENLKDGESESFHFHKANLIADGAVKGAVEACVAKYGPKIDVLANVAGIMDAFESAVTVTDSTWDRVIAVNLTAPVQLMGEVIPYMQKQGKGAIINVASRASESGASAGIAYTCSKHGLAGATKHTAWRFRKEGIRCNAVLPGGVATGISSSMDMTKLDQASYAECMPVNNLHMDSTAPPEEMMKNIIMPGEIANAIYFLASEDAGTVNGVLLPVDKAWSTI